MADTLFVAMTEPAARLQVPAGSQAHLQSRQPVAAGLAAETIGATARSFALPLICGAACLALGETRSRRRRHRPTASTTTATTSTTSRSSPVGHGGYAAPTACKSLSGIVGAPTAAYMEPGQCHFGDDFSPVALLSRQQLTHDTILLEFALPEGKPLGLSTCACLLLRCDPVGYGAEPIVRPYTPVSTNAMLGKFQLVVKVYPDGKASQYLKKVNIGTQIDFKHIQFNVKLQYPEFRKKHVSMLVGGTGIAPMIQALHVILGTKGSTTVTMIFGNKTEKDILCKDLLDKWGADTNRLRVTHVLSDFNKVDASWTGRRGYIDKKMIQELCAPPAEDALIFVCGPPPMYDLLCGPRDKPQELTGLLANMGYKANQVVKF